MAATDFIRTQINNLEAITAKSENIAHCLTLATAGGNEPPWVSLYVNSVLDLTAAADELVLAFNHHCLPLLQDMEKATTSKVSKS